MVGNLYPDDHPLKERAYNIFYMGINIGGFISPLVMEVVKSRFGFHPAFAVAALGMIISVTILWVFKKTVEPRDRSRNSNSQETTSAMKNVPDWKRVMALIVVFAIVIVFWMIFNQNGSTLTFWADDNTDWSVSGTVSNAINSFWIISLTFPLIWFWNWLARHGKEPSTPAKMAAGMLLTAVSFFVLYVAATAGERQQVSPRCTQRDLSESTIESWRNWKLKVCHTTSWIEWPPPKMPKDGSLSIASSSPAHNS
jgi:POT family proton-dependent oligopeptide transporter